MGKKRRHSPTTATAAADAPANRDHASTAYLMTGGMVSGYEAANSSPSRGYLYWPTDNSAQQLNNLTRFEIRRRVQWLYANFGFARRLVKGCAKLIGFLTPQPNTGDESWDDAVFDNFMQRAGSTEIFDAAGKFDFFESQIIGNECAARDGFELQVLTETMTGGARSAFYEAHQLSNGAHSEPYWRDGVRLSDQGKHLGYCLKDGLSGTKFTDFDAQDVIFNGTFESRNQVLPTSILAHCVCNMHDVVETRGYNKHAIKAQSRMGTVLERDKDSPDIALGSVFANGRVKATMAMPDGTTKEVAWDQVLSGAQTPQLPPGYKVKVITDDRPSANNMEFEKRLLDDCALGCDLPPGAIYDLAGFTGPAIRYTMAEIQRWVANKQWRQAKRCQRYYVYHVAKEIKAGRLPQGPANWWSKVEWIGQADMTIDAQRMANVSTINLLNGLTTWMDEWGKANGVFWKRRIRQRVLEVAFAKAQCLAARDTHGVELTYAEVFPGLTPQNIVPLLQMNQQQADATALADTADTAALPAAT